MARLLCFVCFLYLASPVAPAGANDTLTQISTIDALLGGVYDGPTAVKSLHRYGDLGLGTFNSLHGEMILLDGRFYRIAADGEATIVGENAATPFAVVTRFLSDESFPLEAGLNYPQLRTAIDAKLPGKNIFYAFRILGRFQSVKARSVPAQVKPYRPLTQIVQQQSLFHFENVEGTMVGFRTPEYAKNFNVPGYHLHFLTKDKKRGGHVLHLTVDTARVEIDHLRRFLVILPDDPAFLQADLSQDRGGDLETVENPRLGSGIR